jgi:hypothetical protein
MVQSVERKPRRNRSHERDFLIDIKCARQLHLWYPYLPFWGVGQNCPPALAFGECGKENVIERWGFLIRWSLFTISFLMCPRANVYRQFLWHFAANH